PTNGRQSAPDLRWFLSQRVVVFKSCNSAIAPGPTNGRPSAPPDCIWFSFIVCFGFGSSECRGPPAADQREARRCPHSLLGNEQIVSVSLPASLPPPAYRSWPAHVDPTAQSSTPP